MGRNYIMDFTIYTPEKAEKYNKTNNVCFNNYTKLPFEQIKVGGQFSISVASLIAEGKKNAEQYKPVVGPRLKELGFKFKNTYHAASKTIICKRVA